MLILIIACCIIVLLIALGINEAADARINEMEESVNRRAERLARQLVKEWLSGAQITVTQRISVIEDDLKKED